MEPLGRKSEVLGTGADQISFNSAISACDSENGWLGGEPAEFSPWIGLCTMKVHGQNEIRLDLLGLP